MAISKQELAQWRQHLLEYDKETDTSLNRLDREDHKRFVLLCRTLARDVSPVVKDLALRKLGQRGDRDDASAEASALKLLREPDPSFQNTALFALGTVGTTRAFPILWEYAQAGSPFALAAASKQVRTDAQRAQLLTLARQDIMLPGGAATHLREAAVEVLLRHSTVLQEREVLLAAARLLTEDDVVVALGEVDADAETKGAIATELRAIRATYSEGSAEYKALSYAITRLETLA